DGRIIARGAPSDLDRDDNDLVRAFMTSQHAGYRQGMHRRRAAAVGAFVIGGVLLFGAGLFLIGDRRMLFSRTFAVYAEFANLAGLADGAKVRVAGMDAGEVETINVPSN